MTINNIIKVAINNLKQHKIRSLLTIISIAIGIATLTSLIIISQSMQQAVGQRLGGTIDVIRVLPGHLVPGRDFVPFGSFTEESSQIVEEIPGVQDVSTWIVEIAEAEYRGTRAPVEIMGGDSAAFSEFLGDSIKLLEGRLIRDGYNEAILSISTLEHVNQWLGSDLQVNDTLYVNGIPLTIVGIMAYDLAGVEVSHRLLMSKELAQEMSGTEDIMLMMVRADMNMIDQVRSDIKTALDDFYGVVGLTTAIAAQAVVDQVGLVTLIVQSVVIAIALIALVVGAIGIVNVMLMSVLERTRDIGIMKSIGAKKNDILSLFLVEASVTSLIGGILGIIGGLSVALAINAVISRFVLTDMETIVSPIVLIGGVLVALLTGILGGLYPARRAAMLKPVEALRHD